MEFRLRYVRSQKQNRSAHFYWPLPQGGGQERHRGRGAGGGDGHGGHRGDGVRGQLAHGVARGQRPWLYQDWRGGRDDRPAGRCGERGLLITINMLVSQVTSLSRLSVELGLDKQVVVEEQDDETYSGLAVYQVFGDFSLLPSQVC